MDISKISQHELEQIIVGGYVAKIVDKLKDVHSELLSNWMYGNVDFNKAILKQYSTLLQQASDFAKEKDKHSYSMIQLGALLGVVEILEQIIENAT